MLTSSIKILKDDLKLDTVRDTDNESQITEVLSNPITKDIFLHTKGLMRDFFCSLDPQTDKPKVDSNVGLGGIAERDPRQILSHEFAPTLENG